MQTFDADTVATLTSLAVALAVGCAGVLLRRASRGAGHDAPAPDLDKLVRDAPYQRLGNNIRIVD